MVTLAPMPSAREATPTAARARRLAQPARSMNKVGQYREHREMVCLLLQPRRLEHLQELSFGAHVDGFRGQLALAIEKETIRYSTNPESRVHFAVGIQQRGKRVALFLQEIFDRLALFIGNSQHHQPL